MTMEALAATPPKLALINVSTAERIDAQFNPKEFQAQLQVEYSELTMPGGGYQPLQYSHTQNVTMPLTLFFQCTSDEEREQRDAAERFLLALCFPRRGAGSVRQHPPPRMLVVWPRYARLVVVVRSLQIQVTRFDQLMRPAEETFTLSVQTVSDGQVFSEDAAAQGLRRPSPRAVGSRGSAPGDIRGLPSELERAR